MSRIVNVNSSNYKVLVASGGTITFDTSGNIGGVGTVLIKGNLDVQGNVTYLETINSQVKDNIIQLNYDPSYVGNGIAAASNYQSGLEIYRGSYVTAQFIFDESLTHYDPSTAAAFSGYIAGNTLTVTSVASGTVVTNQIIQGNGVSNNTTITAQGSGSGGTGTYLVNVVQTVGSSGSPVSFSTVSPGSFVVKTTDGKLSAIQLASISTSAGTNLTFDMQNTTKVLTIARQSGYENYVVNANDIPNRQFVINYVAAGVFSPGVADVNRIYKADTYVQTFDSSVSDASNPLSPADPTATASTSQVVFGVDGTIQAQLNSNGFYINNLKLKTNTISNFSAGNNLILTATNNNVEVNAVLTLDNQGSTPAYVSTGTKVYSQLAVGPGKTGLFFVNSSNYNDELVAKNRALLLSMIF